RPPSRRALAGVPGWPGDLLPAAGGTGAAATPFPPAAEILSLLSVRSGSLALRRIALRRSALRRSGCSDLRCDGRTRTGRHCYGKTMASVTELVKRYYTTVDAGDADATSALFAADASYDRPGYPTMVGQQITDFYHGERVIDSGAHSLQEILVDGDRASSRGVV